MSVTSKEVKATTWFTCSRWRQLKRTIGGGAGRYRPRDEENGVNAGDIVQWDVIRERMTCHLQRCSGGKF